MSSPVIKYYKTKLKNVYLIKPPTIFKDMRGMYVETYNKEIFSRITRLNFIQDDISVSKKNVLRGIHGDKKTWKLISCVHGKLFLVVVNCKESSKDYLKVFTKILSEKKNVQILVPPGYANGHLCLTDNCIFHYKLSYKGKYSDVNEQKVIKWNDARLKIKWPLKKNLIMSLRDK